jgi:RimJ/RimL family protein N-acetyltransferase
VNESSDLKLKLIKMGLRIWEVNKSMEPVITKRLIIRRLKETDLLDFMAYQSHPESLRYLPEEPLTEEIAMRFLAHQATLEIGEQRVAISFAIHHIADAKTIGEVDIDVLPKKHSQGEIGWLLHPDYQGHGYATEAAQVLLKYLFAEHQLHRITSGCDPRNTASIRLMERLGMRCEGHLKQSKFMKDTWQDEYIYALLRDEWLLRQSINAIE